MRHCLHVSLLALILSGCASLDILIDQDGDGVKNQLDICPNTPQFSQVDKNGCALDSDFDGVIDIYDKCTNTPFVNLVDKNGCSIKE
jgi:OOP family OmpA-OmpF porin